MADFNVKTLEQTRSDYLSTYRQLLIRLGVTDPDVSPGSAIYVHATALAQETASIGYNLSILAQGVLPDSAQGDDLLRHAALLGLSLRPAGGSTGLVTLVSSVSPVAIATGSQLIDPSGLKYKVSFGGSYNGGDTIRIESVDVGDATNLAEGTVLRWSTPPAFVSQTLAVGPGDLTGGSAAEDLEGLRTRVLDAWRAPPGAGNAAQLSAWAESSDPSVQRAFVYPCFQGPATAAVAVVRAPTANDKGRDLDITLIATNVAPYVVSRVPEYVLLSVTAVANQPVNVSFGLSLPDYTSGLGWINQTPFPTFASLGYAPVTGVTSTTVFSINSDAPPQAGVTQIAWMSPSEWRLYRGTVISYTGTGPYTVTVDTPFLNIANGVFIVPDAVNLETYFDAVLTQFANLGPGEKVTAAGLLPRGLRQPLASQSWASSIGPSILKFLSNTGSEVLDVAYLYRSQTSPTVPLDSNDPPNILTPGSIGFYPL
jgi:uncharacterized phage protein gp47/JayE